MGFSVEIGTSTVQAYQSYVSGAVEAFMPLLAAVIGIFIAFAIAVQLQFFIKKLIK
jgi:hypothetical protein